MSLTLPKLTSLSAQTLTLVFERQRLRALSSNTNSSFPTSSLTQITRNFAQLRAGIYALEEEEEDADAGEARLLREQYERMRDMLGNEKELVEAWVVRGLISLFFSVSSHPHGGQPELLILLFSLVERKTPVVESSSPKIDPMTLPYKDDPDPAQSSASYTPYVDAEPDAPFDAANELESQRLLMQGEPPPPPLYHLLTFC